jgi:hypothetical protein
MTRWTYSPLAERLERRREAILGLLGALFLALSIGIPFALYFWSMKP